MNDVASLIRRVAEDLRCVRNAVQATQYEKPGDSTQDGQLNETINPELVTELRGVLDEMRHFLWCYVEMVAAKQPNDDFQSGIDTGYRRLVAEMLQSFSRSAAPLTMKTLPEMASFFERIDFVVSSRLAAEEQRRKLDRGAAQKVR